MSFSRKQQWHYRSLVRDAWKSHCRANAETPRTAAAQDAWYREELQSGLGVASSKDLDQKSDFEKAMAHFEAIVGDSIYWQMRVFRGDARRILHELDRLATGHDLDETYLRAIARRSLMRDDLPAGYLPPAAIEALARGGLPDLHTLPETELLNILRAVRIFVRRRLLRDDPGLVPGPDASLGLKLNYAMRQTPEPVNREPVAPEAADCPF